MQSNPLWLFRIIKGPAFHASLFFMLAGFIFTVKYASLADTFSSRTFIRNRIRDLYPLHALTVALMIPFVVIPCVSATCIDLGRIFFSSAIHLSLIWSVFPFFSYSFNTPSWALSAFFLCYLCFGPILRRIVKISSRRIIVLLMFFCFLPGFLWGLGYAAAGDDRLYLFFHIFAPIRLFEFASGMLLARLYYLNNYKPRAFQIQDFPLLNDLILFAAGWLIYRNLLWRIDADTLKDWLLYHVFLLPLYAVLLYRLARGNGLFAWLFATKTVRELGKCGFYPYLIHIPLISWTCWVSEHVFGYSRFLHSPVNVVVFMIVLYGGSWLYWRTARPKRGNTYREK